MKTLPQHNEANRRTANERKEQRREKTNKHSAKELEKIEKEKEKKNNDTQSKRKIVTGMMIENEMPRRGQGRRGLSGPCSNLHSLLLSVLSDCTVNAVCVRRVLFRV